MAIRIAIHGAAGRMGQRLVALGSADPELKLAAALESAGHPRLGRRRRSSWPALGRSAIAACRHAVERRVDVMIDFSVPAGGPSGLVDLRAAEDSAGAGHDRARRRRSRSTSAQAAREIPLLWAPSMSLAVNLAMKLAADRGRRRSRTIRRSRRRDHRAPSSLQGRRAQRHGPEIRRIDRRRDGPDHAAPRPRGPARQRGRTAKSAITPCAWATTRASTRSSSA